MARKRSEIAKPDSDYRGLYTGLIRLHVLHHAVKKPVYAPADCTSEAPKPRFMSDDDFVDLLLLIQERFSFLPTKDYFIDVVKSIARSNKFHPVRERFDALKWDREKRIDCKQSETKKTEAAKD